VTELSGKNFGIVIAFVVPGLIVLIGVASFSPAVGAWFQPVAGDQTTISGFLFVSFASLPSGLTASAVRWAVIDAIHERTGVRRPCWNDAVLPEHLEAFDYLVQNHYRYYQFYANSLVALVWTYALHRTRGKTELGVWTDVGVALLCYVLFIASRDTMQKYYGRASLLLREGKDQIVTNGNHAAEETGKVTAGKDAPKSPSKGDEEASSQKAESKKSQSR
jgi:hypothetical protein